MKLLGNYGSDPKPTHIKEGVVQGLGWALNWESELARSDLVSQVSRKRARLLGRQLALCCVTALYH